MSLMLWNSTLTWNIIDVILVRILKGEEKDLTTTTWKMMGLHSGVARRFLDSVKRKWKWKTDVRPCEKFIWISILGNFTWKWNVEPQYPSNDEIKERPRKKTLNIYDVNLLNLSFLMRSNPILSHKKTHIVYLITKFS